MYAAWLRTDQHVDIKFGACKLFASLQSPRLDFIVRALLQWGVSAFHEREYLSSRTGHAI